MTTDTTTKSDRTVFITYAASSIDYVRWSRRPEALTGRRPCRTTSATS
ncbi:hypothetical protein [Kitasatospora sp. NPDC015120]